MKKKLNKFDAKGKSLGRLATEVAICLQGKQSPDYQANKVDKTPTVVYNLSLAKFTGQKFNQKKYYRYSGYQSGLKEKTLSELFNKDPRKLFQILIYNMLPKNKLRKNRLGNLKLFNQEIEK